MVLSRGQVEKPSRAWQTREERPRQHKARAESKGKDVIAPLPTGWTDVGLQLETVVSFKPLSFTTTAIFSFLSLSPRLDLCRLRAGLSVEGVHVSRHVSGFCEERHQDDAETLKKRPLDVIAG